MSWSGHLGGAIGGVLMTPPLEWLSRRSPVRYKVLGVVMLLVIAAICLVLLENLAVRADAGDARVNAAMRRKTTLADGSITTGPKIHRGRP